MIARARGEICAEQRARSRVGRSRAARKRVRHARFRCPRVDKGTGIRDCLRARYAVAARYLDIALLFANTRKAWTDRRKRRECGSADNDRSKRVKLSASDRASGVLPFHRPARKLAEIPRIRSAILGSPITSHVINPSDGSSFETVTEM